MPNLCQPWYQYLGIQNKGECVLVVCIAHSDRNEPVKGKFYKEKCLSGGLILSTRILITFAICRHVESIEVAVYNI